MIAFRFNANAKVGFGHYVRCNEVASEIKRRGLKTLAIIDELSNLDAQIADSSFDVVTKVSVEDDASETLSFLREQKCHGMLVDHYHCNEQYQKHFIDAGIAWGQFDFKCEGTYLGRFIVNINPAASKAWYTDTKYSSSLRFLCGPQYAVLKKMENQQRVNEQSNNNKLFICLGGGDDQGLLYKLVSALAESKFVDELHVACGSKSTSIPMIGEQAYTNVHLHVNCHYVYSLMSSCDLAVCTASTLSYELAYVGTPFICGYWAENQKKLAGSWQEAFGVENLGDLSQLTRDDLYSAVSDALLNIKQRKQQAENIKTMVDGHGAKRIAEELIAL